MKKTKKILSALALVLALSFALAPLTSVYAWNSSGSNPQNGPCNLDPYVNRETTPYQWPFCDDRYTAGKNVLSGYGQGATSALTGYADGTGKLPVMAWSSWNAYGFSFINAQNIKDTAQAFVDLGLVELGYEYINMDDGTYSDNNLTPMASKFPNGFTEVGDYIHNCGLKFGMYSSGATRTCGGQGGSWTTEVANAQRYINWGVDYLKYDFCSNPWAGDGTGGAALAGPRVLKLTVTGPDGFSQVINPVDMEAFGAARYIPAGRGNATVPSIVNLGGYWKDVPTISSANWENRSGSSFSAAFLRQTGGIPPVTSELAAMAITPGEALATIKDVPAAGTYTVAYNYSTQQVTSIPVDSVDSLDYLSDAAKAFVKTWNYSATWSTDTAGRYIQVDNVTPVIGDYKAWMAKGPKRIMSFKNEPFIKNYDFNMRVYDRLVDAAATAAGATVTFTVDLVPGDNYLRLYTEKREESALQAYASIKESLQRAAQNAGRKEDIVLSICEWGYNEGSKWGYKVGDHWRSTRDIMSVTGSSTNIWQYTTEAAGWYDPGWAPGAGTNGAWINTSGIRGIKYCYDRTVYRHSDDFNIGLGYGWNDADMMVIGFRDLTTFTGAGSITSTTTNANTMKRFERRHDESHFNSWCMINSALILGTRMFDVNNNGSKATVNTITKETPWVQVISNKDAIALQQDPLAIPGKRIKCSDGSDPYGLVISERADVIAKPLANGDVAIMIFNLDAGPRYADKNPATNRGDYRKSGADINVDEIIAGIGHLMVNKNEFANAPAYIVKDVNTKKVFTMLSGQQLSEAYTDENILQLEPFNSVTVRISPLKTSVWLVPQADGTVAADYIVENSPAGPNKANLLLAVYSDAGKLIDLKSSPIEATGLFSRASLATGVVAPNCTVRGFIWDESYVPMSEAAEYKKIF